MSNSPPEPNNIRLIHDDAFDALSDIEANSVHSVVTDPPYAIDIVGEDWDSYDADEYQGWCEQWAEKCLRVLKPGGHLLAFSSSRTHHRLFAGIEDAGFRVRDTITWHHGEGMPKGQDVGGVIDRYSDEDGDEWTGYSTQLKPATEFCVVAQKPLSTNAIYRNCLKHTTGALNIDACRIPVEDGRYPANLILDGDAASLLDNQSGRSNGHKTTESDGRTSEEDIYGTGNVGRRDPSNSYSDEGGASRFFYTAKASRGERTMGGEIDNPHPTVKPLDLIQYLVRLTTRPGQTILDPFVGSGTTLQACIEEGRSAIGIEREQEYAETARERVLLARTLTETDVDVVVDEGV